jgi:hypothetical protein
VFASRHRFVSVALGVALGVVGCGALTGCDSGTPSAGPKESSAGPSSSTGSAPAGGQSAAPGSNGSTGAAGGKGGSAADPCGLLTPAQGQTALGKPLGTGKEVGTGDLRECVYASGPVVIAVLKSQYTEAAFRKLAASQGGGDGKTSAVSGLGDAAFAYGKTGIVEVLKGSTVLSVTSSSTATSEAVARAALPRLS